MQMMNAARLHDVAQPFRVDSVPVPEPTGGDVLVRVRACGVVPNLRNVVSTYPEWFPFLPLPATPAIYGLDPTGEIAAVGPDVIGLSPGQRVYVNPLRPCGSCFKCRGGEPISCASLTFAGYFGFTPDAARMQQRYPWGGFAEYMVAPAASIVILPDGVSYEEGARFGYQGTSYGGLVRAQAGSHSSLLVNGATGTLGVSAVMLALAMGVPKILAVARNRDLLERVRALAPKRIVTHSNQDGSCTDWARAQTDGLGPDIVLDALGPGAPVEATMDAMMSVSRGGKIVTIGGMDHTLPFDPIWLMCNNISYLGSCWFTTAQGEDMARMADSGSLDLSSLNHLRFPLDQVNEALDTARNRAAGGFDNVVVMV